MRSLSATFEAFREAGAYLGLALPIHGDLHLGQVLVLPEGGLRVVDFEGEPNRAPHERLHLDSPLRDVAGMLRSFDYAVCTVLPEDERTTWRAAAERAFLSAYEGAVEKNRAWHETPLEPGHGHGPRLWPDAEAFAPLLRLYVVQKAVYEVEYERAYRPDRAWIPEQALARLLDEAAQPRTGA